MEKPVIRKEKLLNPTEEDDAGAWLRAWVSRKMPNTFYQGDIDVYTYKRDTNILRIWEAKWPNEKLSLGERCVFKLLDFVIKLGVAMGKLAKGSGVFIIRYKAYTFDIDSFIIETLNGKSREFSIEETKKIIEGLK